jgi:Uma2 family endonuclease
MATQPAYSGWTYAEFARLPDDGNRYEVIAGELHMTPAPRLLHQKIVTRLGTLIEAFTQEHQLGEVFGAPVDVLLGEGDYLEPDLVFVRRERANILSDRGIEAAPDLVVEVLSEGTAARDRGLKRERYAHFGVPEYWIIDPHAGHVEVFRFAANPRLPAVIERETLVWQPVPGGPSLTIDVRELVRPVAGTGEQP